MPYDDYQIYIENPFSEESFEVLSSEFEILKSEGTIEDFQEFSDLLTTLLINKGMELQRQNPAYYDAYSGYALLSKFKAFVAFPPKEQDELLQRRILFAIQKGFNPTEIIRQYFDFYETDDYPIEALRTLAKNLEQNIEKLGTASIDIDGHKVIPQIKYWVADYGRFPTITPMRGGIERLNYLNKSVNSRALTQSQRAQLLAVLKFYDELLHPARPAPERHDSTRVVLEKVGPVSVGAKSEIIEKKLQELKKRTGN